MTVNSKMTALADEIRELSGTTDTKNLDEMRVDVDTANTEIAFYMAFRGCSVLKVYAVTGTGRFYD